jgi:hypothetical protein
MKWADQADSSERETLLMAELVAFVAPYRERTESLQVALRHMPKHKRRQAKRMMAELYADGRPGWPGSNVS